MQVDKKKLAPILIVGALALLGGAIHAACFLADMHYSSFLDGAGKYHADLPMAPAVNVKQAPMCEAKEMRWVGCNL